MEKHKIDSLLQDLDELDAREYKRTLEIYKNKEHKDEYFKLIYNGFMQHFIKLGFSHLKYAVLCGEYKSKRLKFNNEPWINLYFSPSFFNFNRVYYLSIAINNIATLVKFRFTKPDNYISANFERIQKEAKKVAEYRTHKVYSLINDLLGNHNYNLLMKFRKNIDHGLNPEYGNVSLLDTLNFSVIEDKIFEILEAFYYDILNTEINISNIDIDKYRIKEFPVVKLPSVQEQEIFDYIVYNNKAHEGFINVINNYYDYLLPFMKQKNQIKPLLNILSDIVFRFHEVFRAFSYFFLLYRVENVEDHLPTEILEIINLDDYQYFMNLCLTRTYSVHDKLGLFFTKTYSLHGNKTYFKNVSELLIKNEEDHFDELLTDKLNKIISSPSFKSLDFLRQQFMHGTDFSFKQTEGTVVFDDYFLICLYLNNKDLLALIKYMVYNFFPAVVKEFLDKDLYKQFDDLIYRMTTTINPHMAALISNFNLNTK
ncbi:hypothetical protein FC605_10345 [Bacillus subtilis]|uniref:Cthe_2314 family HEPN domain-containing protein n=1 Tax=Bacillus TaxID=1386 RepID=UPI0009B64FEA|nr:MULTISPECIES: Cthe_2314 family HEPN domain-containing protein [Bacillus]ARB37307.1 hypothetical protein BSK2_10280 [Bacillus subtilis]QCU15217.1 hypothetical protein FC605_10345 [Bacillus subtilis]